MAPATISEQDTWISVDPIVGCPAECDYCYLGALNLRRHRPRRQVDPVALVDALSTYLAGRVDGTPVAIGNYTDMAMTPPNRTYLEQFAQLFAKRFPERPLVVITKSPRVRDVVDRLADIGHPIIIFLSHSFSDKSGHQLESGPISSWGDMLKTIENIAGRPPLRAVHFWRPFLSALNPSESFGSRVRGLRDAGALGSVVVGYKSSPNADDKWSPATRALLSGDEHVRGGSEYFPELKWDALRAIAATERYPVYRNTSCGIALAMARPEALRTMSAELNEHYCKSTTCPAAQRARCAAHESVPVDQNVVLAALQALSVAPDSDDYKVEGAHVSLAGGFPESDLSVASHISGLRVRAASVQPMKAWINTDLQVAKAPS